jgi:3'(2'), 5'-bisphosphate nucleotidase
MTFSPAERDRLSRAFADIASVAGVAVMEVYRSDFETRSKADQSPVSDADERAEVIILEHLARLLPGVPVVAEEASSRDGFALKPAGQDGAAFLLVDPVDGTREFIQRRGDFTVNIALIEAGLPVAGVVFAPARKEICFAGASAHCADGFTEGMAIKDRVTSPLRTRAYPEAGLTAVTSSSHLDAATRAFLATRRIAGQSAIGSSLKFCLLARGAADIYPRFGPTMEWDTAAGQAVLMAAGGCVMTPEGAVFTYGDSGGGYRNGPFIAWGREPE